MLDHRTAPIGERLRATLAFVEKLSRTPEDISPADIALLRAAGCSDDDIRHAAYVCFCFAIMTRIADAFDFPVGDQRAQCGVGRILWRVGYTAGTLPG